MAGGFATSWPKRFIVLRFECASLVWTFILSKARKCGEGFYFERLILNKVHVFSPAYPSYRRSAIFREASRSCLHSPDVG